MERLERKPKSGAGEKTFVAFRATGWPGVDNALLTSTVQTAQFKQQGNKWRGQLKVLKDHTGASIEPISVNGPQGETRADALQKLETHYAMPRCWRHARVRLTPRCWRHVRLPLTPRCLLHVNLQPMQYAQSFWLQKLLPTLRHLSLLPPAWW